jgi:hypothetical protein
MNDQRARPPAYPGHHSKNLRVAADLVCRARYGEWAPALSKRYIKGLFAKTNNVSIRIAHLAVDTGTRVAFNQASITLRCF